jgi:sterol desaturase/sphingolipid hydroxylase (fatty acid hydroxylase superfamily)
MPGLSEMTQGSLAEIFFRAQASQISSWLLNYKLYAVVALLLGLSFVWPIYRVTRSMFVGVAHDYVYGVFHAIVVFPFLAIFIFAVQRTVVSVWPALDLKLYSYLPAWGQIALAFCVNDFLGYVSHYLRHKIQPLWFFHVIHHSQQWVNPLTVKRSHFVEKFFDYGVVKAVPFIVLGTPIETWAIYYAIDAAWDYFEHSNVDTDLGPLRYVLVSPRYHMLHHSRLPEHFDKNFSDRLVLWDLVFGTASFDYRREFPTGVNSAEFALEAPGRRPLAFFGVFFQQLWYPFRMNYAYLKEQLRLADTDRRPASGGAAPTAGPTS